MKKSISKLIVAFIAIALAMPMSSFAQASAHAKKATTKQSVNAPMRVQQTDPRGHGLSVNNLGKVRSNMRSVNDVMFNAKRMQTGKVAIFRAPALNAPVATSAKLYGSVIYSTDNARGLYEVSLTGSLSPIVIDNYCIATYGGVEKDGLYYCTAAPGDYAYHEIFNIETGVEVKYASVTSYTELATDMALDPISGIVYGCFYNEERTACTLSTMDLDTWKTTPICDLPAMWSACAFDAEGNLFAIDADGVLYSVNKTNGAMTEIGSTGVVSAYLCSAAIDPGTGTMFWSVSPEEGGGFIYAVNTATAEATMVCEFEGEDEITGMYFGAPEATSGAPGAVSDLEAHFSGGQTVGSITFKMPETLFDGSAPADNSVKYTIEANGEVIAQNNASYGEEIDWSVSLSKDGAYTFTVYASNADGDGPKSEVNIFVGQDTPDTPANVVVDYADGTMTVTWDAVAAGINNGYVGDVTYTVTRIANGAATEVATGLTACTFTESIAEPATLTAYYYSVTAVAGGKESAPGVSNTITLGTIEPPYAVDFTTAKNLDGFTIIDANNDGKTWSLYGDSGVRIPYNSSKDMDDWFVTPAIMLEKGKMYTFSFVAKAQSNTYMERAEAGFAAAATAEALAANIIIEPKEVGEELTTFSGTVIPEADGKYYFGIHGCSDKDKFNLFIRSLEISAGVSASGPAAPTDLEVVPAADGSKSAEVSFIAPDKDINGDAIDALTSASIYANGEKVAEIANPTPGAKVTETINVATSGTYDIEVSASSVGGEGLKATAKVYIGVNIAAAPTNVNAVEIGNTGKVIVSWTAPTTDKDGNPINPELITYKVVNYDDDVLAEGVTGTSVEVTAWEGEGQTFDYFDVTAVTEAGESAPASSPMIAIGTPYDMPMVEGFTDGNLDFGMGATSYGAEWYVFDLETLGNKMDWLAGIEDADGCNGLAVMYGNKLNASSDFFTGKVEITGQAPVASFSYYTQEADDENVIDVYIKDAEGNMNFKGEYVMSDGEVGGWTEVQIPLDEYVGQAVQLYLRGIIKAYTTITVDAIKVINLPDYDLSIAGATAPAKVAPGKEFNINVEVANEGAKDVEAYSIELSLNGKVIDTANCGAIASGEKATVEFAHTFTPVDPEENVFTATIVYADDENDANNSVEINIIIDTPNYPTVSGLIATETPEGVVLNWDAPDMNDLPKEAVTEDFESYEPFSLDISPWTLIDGDGQDVGGIEGVTLPVSACAFFVFNNESENFNQSFAAHSGVQYMSTMFNNNGNKQSDWMISPELTGNAQTISLYARSYTSSYGLETMSIYYSTTDADPASFTMISTHKCPAEWTEYTADLPAGAKYFAIVCESKDVFMLFVDDVTYIPADGAVMDLNIVGYNIYRDGVLINDTPVTDTSFTDATAQGVCEYVVTVVYAEGESAPCDPVSITSKVADAISAAAVKVEGRTIVVTGAEGSVAVFAADGKAVYRDAAAARNEIVVAPGIYMVNNGKRTYKVIVR